MNKSAALEISISALRKAVTEYGILASTLGRDNYKRIWSRDGVIGGIAGLICQDEVIIEGLERTLQTLAKYQHPLGIIPSNIGISGNQEDYSLGSLVGRVDATTWYIIGTCLLLKHRDDVQLNRYFRPSLEKAIEALNYLEYNAAGLLYTPLSGNWADEYPVRGHTLYDNLLRLWGLSLYADHFGNDDLESKLSLIKEKISANFWPVNRPIKEGLVYNRRLYELKAGEQLNHWLCFLAPDRFDDTFDAAGNALALLLGIGDNAQQSRLIHYIKQIFTELRHNLIPAFWPPIREGDAAWPLLANNYSFRFKNTPHNFHNGGIWPVWMGLFALGLSKIGEQGIIEKMINTYLELEELNNFKFSEYINSSNFELLGQEHLTFSAAGLTFMIKATEEFPKILRSHN